jgi:hypothetical protein
LVSVLVFPASVVCAGSSVKAERPPETRHDCAVFFDRLALCCINPPNVLEFAASNSLYDDALIGHGCASACLPMCGLILNPWGSGRVDPRATVDLRAAAFGVDSLTELFTLKNR